MSFEIQHKIKQNAQQLNAYVSDLYSWEKQMQTKQTIKNQVKKQNKVKIQEQIRKKQIEEIQKIQQQNKKRIQNAKNMKKDLVRDINTVGDYYKAWDKFNPDQELERLEQQQKRLYKPYNPYQDSKNNLRAKPKTKININSRRNIVVDPSDLKDRGNLHFKSLQFEKAIECYTECIKKANEQNIAIQQLNQQKKKLICVVLSNRSMTYLKLRQTIKALDDANQSIKYDKNYAKSYYRRAQCYKILKRYGDSLRDFKKVKQLQSDDKKVDGQIKVLQAYFKNKSKQARQKMIIEYNASIMAGSKKIQIKQVEQFEERKQKQQINYLQQL